MSQMLKDILNDIASGRDFSIIADEEFMDLAEEFKKKIIRKIDSTSSANSHEQNGEILIVISKSGRQPRMIDEIKSAMKRKAKIYAICGDFRSPLALLSDNVIVLSDLELFTQNTEEILLMIYDNVSSGGKGSRKPISVDPSPDAVTSLLQGLVVKVNVRVGDNVRHGDVLYVLEAMKMENEVTSDRNGTVIDVFIKRGDYIASGDTVMMIG